MCLPALFPTSGGYYALAVGVLHLSVSLRASKTGARQMSRDDFEAPLRIEARSPVIALKRGTRPSEASRAIFLNLDLEALSASAEPTEAFADTIDAALTNMASWLRERSPAEFDGVRACGVRLDVFIGGAIDNDQFELKLPAAFTEACGSRGLPIQIVTND